MTRLRIAAYVVGFVAAVPIAFLVWIVAGDRRADRSRLRAGR